MLKDINKVIALILATFIGFSSSVFAQANYELKTNNYKYSKKAQLQGQVTVVPNGTKLKVTTQSTISTTKSNAGDMFIVAVTQPLILNSHVVIPSGSALSGQVVYKENAGRMSKNGVLDVRFIKLTLPDGRNIPISGKIAGYEENGTTKSIVPPNSLIKNTAIGTAATGGVTLAGLSIGAIAGDAAVGTIAGVATGGTLALAWVVGKKGKEIVIPSGTNLIIKLREPLTIDN